MPQIASRARTAVLLAVGLLVSLLLATGHPGSAAAAERQGVVNGNITLPQGEPHVPLKMLWFDRDWNYLGQRSVSSVGYSIWLDPGTYHLQFVDQRPSYDVRKYAPTDVLVRVRATHDTTRNVTMRRGAVVTGTVRAGGEPARGAKVVAADQADQSFATVANRKGQFAIGGLPAGKYCLFTYDRTKAWAGKCSWVGGLAAGQGTNTAIRLGTRAGSMTLYVFTPSGRLPGKATVTVVSRATGQWWTATAHHGTAEFRGLYPGRYTLKFDGSGVWLPATGAVRKARVRSSRMAFGSFHLTKRGGWITGTVVDRADPEHVLPDATVLLFDRSGNQLASATTDADGNFTLDGQLTTQEDLTVVAQPGPYSDYLGQEPYRCRYNPGRLPNVTVTTGQKTDAGDVELPRQSGQSGNCASSSDRPAARR